MANRLAEIVAAFSDPSFFGSTAGPVAVVQTHISWVFLLEREVYKLKKPVRFAFLDFRDLERRRHFCREEVRLNRRLAADVYLGVVGIRPTADGFELVDEDAEGICEVAVHMRRLPESSMLPELLDRGAVDDALIARLVARLVAFHAEADDGPEVRAAGDPERVLAQMENDFAETSRFHGKTIAADDDAHLQSFCRREIARRADLLRARCRQGRVRDGHGDLHAEHVCVRSEADGGLAIFDCIEFEPEFRRRDVAGEIAFLAMDFEFRGHPGLAAKLVAEYASQADDERLPELIPLFACHRAYIRGKVDSLKSEEDEVESRERAAAARSARRHFALARRYTWRARPVLVVVGGLSGTGKSSLARELADRTGWSHHSSDRIRKEIAGIEATSRVGAGDEAGLYSRDMHARTYDELHHRARVDLQEGHGAILDATFLRRRDRERAAKDAERMGALYVFVECVAPEAITVERLRARAAADDDPSDADEAVFRRQCEMYERPDANESLTAIRADMSLALERVSRIVENKLAGRLRR